MQDYLKKHTTQAAYTTWVASTAFITPNVSLIDADGSVEYNPISQGGGGEPVTPSHNYANDYFTTIPLADATFTFTVNNGEISYSTDNGSTWSESTSREITVSNVTAGNKVLWKGALESSTYGNTITCDESFNVEGNAMSLLYGDNFANQTVIPENASLMQLFEKTPLVNAQNLILPATTLSQSCYFNMFYDCSSLTTAPELPATTLTDQCYRGMFQGCSSLTTAPELPATILAEYCYYQMFRNCSSLNYIKCLATDISGYDCTTDWVDNVAASGTFVKNTSMSSWTTTGYDGIPEGWTVQDAA